MIKKISMNSIIAVLCAQNKRIRELEEALEKNGIYKKITQKEKHMDEFTQKLINGK